jgi:hypothetical protein
MPAHLVLKQEANVAISCQPVLYRGMNEWTATKWVLHAVQTDRPITKTANFLTATVAAYGKSCVIAHRDKNIGQHDVRFVAFPAATYPALLIIHAEDMIVPKLYIESGRHVLVSPGPLAKRPPMPIFWCGHKLRPDHAHPLGRILHFGNLEYCIRSNYINSLNGKLEVFIFFPMCWISIFLTHSN